MDLEQAVHIGAEAIVVVPLVGEAHDHPRLVGAKVDGLEAVLEECGFIVVADFPAGEEEGLSRLAEVVRRRSQSVARRHQAL